MDQNPQTKFLRQNGSTPLGDFAYGGFVRSHGFTPETGFPLYLFDNDKELKAHLHYAQAKAGVVKAAIELVVDLAMPLIKKAEETFEAEMIFAAPHAVEATGDNAIPQVLATLLALACHGEVDYAIVQAAKVFHTGADPMERMNLRPFFDGAVLPGKRYVLVDDVSTMGGTLAELGNFIQIHGGEIAGCVVIVNASRSGRLHPLAKTVRLLERRFGHEIREIFGVEPGALTADEANYLIGFRSADEIRGRSAKAREETDLRLRAKGIYTDQSNKGTQARLSYVRRLQMVRAEDARRNRRRKRKVNK